MGQIRFSDANCTVGPIGRVRPELDTSAEAVLADLARHGVHEALCAHSIGHEYDAMVGNDVLMSMDLASAPVRVDRCFCLVPHHAGEAPAGEELSAYLRHGRAAAVRLYPADHGYDMTEVSVGRMLAVLEELGLPVLVDLAQCGWGTWDGLLASHTRLWAIATRIGYREDRRSYTVLERHERLLLETSYLVGHRAIEHFVARFGAQRLVFGTGAPHFAPGGAISPVAYAEIDDGARAAIAGGNLRRLLRGAEAVA